MSKRKEVEYVSQIIILAHQIRTISKKRLQNLLGNIDNAEIQEKVNDALRVYLNL